MPKSPWSATGEAGALRLERSLCSSNEDSVLPKKKKSFKIPRNKGLSVLGVHCLWVWRAGMQERKGSLCELGRAFC